MPVPYRGRREDASHSNSLSSLKESGLRSISPVSSNSPIISTGHCPAPQLGTRPRACQSPCRGTDEHESGPGAAGVLLPDHEVGVVYDGVLDFVAQDGASNTVGSLLRVEFGRMDSDYREFTSVLFLQFPQLRKHMHAVNSTVSPEIEDEHLAAEIGKRQRAFGVQPIQAVGKSGALTVPVNLRAIALLLASFALSATESPGNRLCPNSAGHCSILYAIDQNMYS